MNNDAKLILTDKDTALKKKLLENELTVKTAKKDLDVGEMNNKKDLSNANADLQKARLKNWSGIVSTGFEGVGDMGESLFQNGSRIANSGTEFFKDAGKFSMAYNGFANGIPTVGSTGTQTQMMRGPHLLYEAPGGYQVAGDPSAKQQTPIVYNFYDSDGKKRSSKRSKKSRKSRLKRKLRLAKKIIQQAQDQNMSQQQVDQLIEQVTPKYNSREAHRTMTFSQRQDGDQPGTEQAPVLQIPLDALYDDSDYDDEYYSD